MLGIDDSGLVKVFTMPVTGSVLFSDGTTLASDPAHFFWNDTNNRLGILTNTPAYSLDVNGTVRASTSLITPVIGNAAGITANNTWTFTSNVNVPVTPVDATHAASKQYVDNIAITGLKLGAAIKTVADSNIGLSGLSAVNGYTPIAGDRVLVIGQTTATENGVYDAASGGWTRSTDSDTDAELLQEVRIAEQCKYLASLHSDLHHCEECHKPVGGTMQGQLRVYTRQTEPRLPGVSLGESEVPLL
jgi:hypothetical protein